MRIIAATFPLLICLFVALPAAAQDSQPPAAIAEKMAFKLARGATNVVTCIGELPKQTMQTVNEYGAVGYIIGPLKGVVMTLYRGVVGGVETLFFMVPQPGYYDPMLEPPYVWNDWDGKQHETATVKGE